ncbi:integration host factor subunit alpha [Methylocystis parvus]|jgi:integration host factor subunit alpha|uniref:integration host factor subunit alpha n=1 Tax=Methylocystis parvus TaxID=134 RepID=UPI003C760D37
MAQGQVLSSVGGVADADDENQKTTTRADLAEAVHLKTGLGRTESAKYVEMVLDEIFDCIVSREEVKLSSFGAFVIRAKKERLGRNPKTGEGAKITARLVVSFKPSNILRAKINEEDLEGLAAEGSEFDDPNERRKGNGKSR